MTEADWMASEDPARMLPQLTHEVGKHASGSWSFPRDVPLASDRKLRLFAEACRSLGYCGTAEDQSLKPPAEDASHMARCVNNTPNRAHRPAVAALLRDVVGNPFRPPPFFVPRSGSRPDFLTPQVLSLAQAAYDERPGRECGECGGVGQRHQVKALSGERAWMVCPDCKGAGRIEDGTLDPLRLAILADAMEDAGCPIEERCGECPKPPKAKTDGNNYYGRDMVAAVIEWGKRRRACRCGGSGRVPYPLLAHLRSPGPHVRGCWVLDCVLGLE